MSSPTPSEQQRWGAELATLFQEPFPNLAEAVRGGVAADCAEPFKAQDPRLLALLTTLENAMHYLVDRGNTLQSQNTALQTDIDQKKDQIIRLSDSLVNKTPVSSTTRKSKDPEKFGGTEKDISKRQKEYVNWRSQVMRCLNVDKTVFNSEYLRIMHVASLMTDSAYELHRIHFKTTTNHEYDPDRWHWKTTEDLFRDLNAQYETLDLSREARQKLDDLLMKNKPFPTFLAEFQALASQCGKTSEQMVEQLRIKVSQELFDEIAHKDDLPGPADFSTWCKLYQKIYDNLKTQKHVLKLRNSHPGASRPRQNSPQQSSALTPQTMAPQTQQNTATVGDPMVLDGAQGAPSREECFARGLCHYCKKPGHMKNDCEDKKRADARWAGLGRGRGRGHPFPAGRGQTRWPQQTEWLPRTSGNPFPRPPTPPRQFYTPTPVQPAWNQRVRVLDYNDTTPTSSPAPTDGSPATHAVYPRDEARHLQSPSVKE
jgi:hypothetical protein